MKEFQKSPNSSKNESLSCDNCCFVKSMLNTMFNPVCHKDKNGIYPGVNKNFARLIAGIPEEEIVGFTLLEVAISTVKV